MQQRVVLPQPQVNAELLKNALRAPLWYWGIMAFLGAIVVAGSVAVGFLMNKGFGLSGTNRPVMWGILIVDFVFWIGISHAGVMLSAILRLSKAEWRRPATRAAEVLTVFSLMIAALHPVVHAGRPWRIIYWSFPYDFSRGLWVNIRSPLIWDPSAIFTYLTGSALFVIVALIPDMAVIRDHTTGLKQKVYRALAMGWRGTPRQWKLQIVAGFLLSALLLPVFVSVHSIVSWDFAVMIGVEGYHVTIFAPYFVIGAVHSGVSAVVTMMILMKWMFGWGSYIREEHVESLAKLLIVIGTTWLYFFFVEFSFALYSMESQEIALREMQAFTWPYWPLALTFILFSYIIPIPLWLFRKVRRNFKIMFWTSLLVNIGMWLERFLIIVPSLARKQVWPFDWSTYHPSAIEVLIVVTAYALVFLLLMTFAKLFPLIPLFDIKEGQTLSDDIVIGKRRVPALRVEE
ncbi:MAG: polysulfide reductase NrfD [Chloroflexi bacterium]|nr:polysulfide reductase NrfD [Chloroflexota bacterium]MBI4197939.1 polysulfide reductase NrfD [Chloroflexota bacterium]